MLYWIETMNYGSGCCLHFKDRVEELPNMKSIQFINAWCLNNACTYEGRREAMKYHLHIAQKIPILISEIRKDLLFPTSELSKKECVWVNYKYVRDVKGNHKHSKIYFVNDLVLTLNCDVRSVRMQMNRCKEFLELL